MRQHIHTCFEKIVNCDYVMEYGISRIAGDHSSVYVFQSGTTVEYKYPTNPQPDMTPKATDRRIKINLYVGTPERCKEALGLIRQFLASNRRVLDFTLWDSDKTEPDIDNLFQQLEWRVLELGDIQASHRRTGGIGFKASHGRAQFVSIYQRKHGVALYLRIPLHIIDDPLGLCRHRSGDWRPVKLTSVERLDDVMELVQQAYDFNMKT